MPRRCLRRRSLDDSIEQEPASAGASAPVLTDARADSRLTELLITRGPENGNGNGRAVPPTSVARLQRLAGNRAVADRLGGGGTTIQRAPKQATDEEELLPEPEAGEIESTTKPAAPEAEPATGEPGPEAPGHEVLPEAGEIESTTKPAAPEAGPATGEPELAVEGPSPVVEQAQGEPLPAGDQTQISIMNAAGANATVTAVKATAGTEKLSAVAVSFAAAGFANALRLTMSRAVQWRSKILGFAPKVAGKAARMLTALRMNAGKAIQNIVLRVKSVADAARGVIAWARRALGLARAAARGIGSKLRSALGGAGEAVLKLLSSLLAPARKALGGLLKTGSEILLDGVKRVRANAASAVAFVTEEAGTRVEAALAKVVDLVRAVVKAALERARQAMAVIHERVGAIRAQLLAMTLLARSMLFAARSRATQGTSTALAAIATAIANGYPQLRSGRGRMAFRQTARMWRLGVRRIRTRARGQLASGMASVKLFQGAGKAVVGGTRAEARANYQATRTSLTNLETTAAIEAGELAISVGVAGALAAGAIDAAVTQGETLIREIAGEGDGDARELQGLINRVGK